MLQTISHITSVGKVGAKLVKDITSKVDAAGFEMNKERTLVQVKTATQLISVPTDKPYTVEDLVADVRALATSHSPGYIADMVNVGIKLDVNQREGRKVREKLDGRPDSKKRQLALMFARFVQNDVELAKRLKDDDSAAVAFYDANEEEIEAADLPL